MELYSPGTNVLLDEDIEATIVTVSIHSNNYIQYECAWWNGLTRTREWFNECEITLNKQDKDLKIGFGASDGAEQDV